MNTQDKPNILFIMIDQLRADALSCYGNAIVDTPNIDRLAQKGVKFNRAYTQGTSCGNSRGSFYTGRHPRSHGATWNDWPFDVSEWTLADYMKEVGLTTVLLGKTHMKPDYEGMKRLGIDPDSDQAQALLNAGFTIGEHDDGLHPVGPKGNYSKREPAYFDYLRSQGFTGTNPWLTWANSGVDEQGDVRSGFYMSQAHLPARTPSEHSETTYLTNRAIETIDQLGDQPWCLHVSYIKPHWPYIAPAPYHQMYRDVEIPKALKSASERDDPHPIYKAFMGLGVSKTFSDDGKRAHVLPAYYGLVKQVDDELGRLFRHLEASGRDKNTVIVVTADHGDYLGDHWLGEKDLFHDQASRIPFIIYDPRIEAPVHEIDTPVAAIDLIPTFIDFCGGEIPAHRLEGRSLTGLLKSGNCDFERELIVAEDDFGRFPFANQLTQNGRYTSRMTMGFDGRYKLIHCPGHRPMLFDLQEDPGELIDFGKDPSRQGVVTELSMKLLDWSSSLASRPTVSRAFAEANQGLSLRQGILVGFWDHTEVPEDRRPPQGLGER